MSVWSEALTFPSTIWGGTFCADADMGQLVTFIVGNLADEAVRFSWLAPPCSNTIVSLAHTLPILNLIVFPSHQYETGAGVGVGSGRGVGVGTEVGVGTNVGIGLGVGVGTEVAVGTNVGVLVGVGLGVYVGCGV